MPITWDGIEAVKTLRLADLIDYVEEDVAIKKLIDNDAVSVTLYALDEDEELSYHEEEDADSMITCLENVGKVDMYGIENYITEGETVFIPRKHPFAVYAEEGQFKMIITVVK